MHLSPSSIEELRVPVRRAEVAVQTEREERPVVVFLAPDTSPEELFEQDAPFFPAEQDGVVRLFARASIVSIVVEESEKGMGDESGPASLSVLGIPYAERPITVHLRNGKVITGTVKSIGRTRTLDVVNQPSKSFAVHAEGKIHHVAKAHVEHIVEVR